MHVSPLLQPHNNKDKDKDNNNNKMHLHLFQIHVAPLYHQRWMKKI